MKKESFRKSVRNHYRNIVNEDSAGIMAMTFNVLVTKEENVFVAHCLELDIVATGSTLEEAQRDVIDLIDAQINYAFSNNNLENLFHPAPQEVWELFFSCEEQIEEKHPIKTSFEKDKELKSFIPPWIITKTCLALQSSHV